MSLAAIMVKEWGIINGEDFVEMIFRLAKMYTCSLYLYTFPGLRTGIWAVISADTGRELSCHGLTTTG